jgi:hypothetical protein
MKKLFKGIKRRKEALKMGISYKQYLKLRRNRIL